MHERIKKNIYIYIKLQRHLSEWNVNILKVTRRYRKCILDLGRRNYDEHVYLSGKVINDHVLPKTKIYNNPSLKYKVKLFEKIEPDWQGIEPPVPRNCDTFSLPTCYDWIRHYGCTRQNLQGWQIVIWSVVKHDYDLHVWHVCNLTCDSGNVQPVHRPRPEQLSDIDFYDNTPKTCLDHFERII